MATVITLVIATIGWGLAIWLANEHKKKFEFESRFCQHHNTLARAFDLQRMQARPEWMQSRGKGMYNFVVRSNKPFAVKIGFMLKVGSWRELDPYGCAYSRPATDGIHQAVIATYLGNGACEFTFTLNTGDEGQELSVTCNQDDQELTPDEFYGPHGYQKHAGIYA